MFTKFLYVCTCIATISASHIVRSVIWIHITQITLVPKHPIDITHHPVYNTVIDLALVH